MTAGVSGKNRMLMNMELRQIERQIQERTGFRINNLSIEVRPDTLVLLGEANSYHVKQLALCGARELLPTMPVTNAITVVKPHHKRQPVHAF